MLPTLVNASGYGLVGGDSVDEPFSPSVMT